MKKILALLLTVGMVLGLFAGCGNSNTTPPAPPPLPTPPPPTPPPLPRQFSGRHL